MMRNLQLTNNSFEWKMWHFRGSEHTLTPSTHFQAVKTPNPQDLRPWLVRRLLFDGGTDRDDDRCRNRRRARRGAHHARLFCSRRSPSPPYYASGWTERWAGAGRCDWLQAASAAEASLRLLADDCVDAFRALTGHSQWRVQAADTGQWKMPDRKTTDQITGLKKRQHWAKIRKSVWPWQLFARTCRFPRPAVWSVIFHVYVFSDPAETVSVVFWMSATN